MNGHPDLPQEFLYPGADSNCEPSNQTGVGATIPEPTTSAVTVPASKIKKRQRIVNPVFEALGACDSCRAKRVKCIRLCPDDPTCEYCRKRYWVCANKTNDGIRYKPRGSKKVPPPPESLPSPSGTEAAPSYSAHDASPAVATLDVSHASVENRLMVMEDSETMMGQLMDCSFKSFLGPVAKVRWSDLRTRFENAGRRLKMLDSASQTVAMAFMALGALQSDHPLIVGPNAPRQQDVKAAGAAQDLSYYARQRAPFCQRLVDRVVAMVDFRGVFRKAEVESVHTLILTKRIITHMAGRETELARPYFCATANLLQQMREAGTVSEQIMSPITFLIWNQDSMRSALTGSSFQIPEAAVAGFLNSDEHFCVSLTMEHLRIIPDAISLDLGSYGGPLIAFWYSAARQMRHFAAEITIPLRRKTNIQASDFARHLSEADSLFNIYWAASEVATKLKPLLDQDAIEIQTQTLGQPVLMFVESTPLLACPFLLAFSQHFKRWNLARSMYLVPEPEQIRELEEVAVIQMDLSRMLVDAVLLIKHALEEIKDSAEQWPTNLNWQGVQYSLSSWATIALSTECAEDGGPLRYTRAVKLDACRFLIDSVRAQSWIWEYLRDEAAHLELQYQQFLVNTTNTVTATHPTVSQDNGSFMPLHDYGFAVFIDDPNPLAFYHPQHPVPVQNEASTGVPFDSPGASMIVPIAGGLQLGTTPSHWQEWQNPWTFTPGDQM